MPGHLKLDRLLSDAHREEFKRLAAHPGTRVEDAHKWVRERGYDVGRNAVYAWLRRQRPDRPRKYRPSKLERLVKPEDRPILEAMCSDPATTVAEVHAWTKQRGYEISRIACWRHLNGWREEMDEVRRCARFARSLAQIAKDLGTSAVSGGAVLGFEQVVLENVFQLRQRDELGARELTDWAEMLERSLGVREHIESIRLKAERADRKALAAAGKGADAEKPRIVNGVEIANCVRRILGVPLPGEPVPEGPMLPLLPPAPPQLPQPLGSGFSTEHTEGTEGTEKEESG
jgi:hypothetical protein